MNFYVSEQKNFKSFHAELKRNLEVEELKNKIREERKMSSSGIIYFIQHRLPGHFTQIIYIDQYKTRTFYMLTMENLRTFYIIVRENNQLKDMFKK